MDTNDWCIKHSFSVSIPVFIKLVFDTFLYRGEDETEAVILFGHFYHLIRESFLLYFPNSGDFFL